MTSMQALAELLYAAPEPAVLAPVTEPVAPAPVSEVPIGDPPSDAPPVQADDEVDPEFAALRADRMYDGIASAVPDDLLADVVGQTLGDGFEVTPELAQAATTEMRAILIDLQATPADVASFAEALRQPMPAEQAADASIELLNSSYGDRATHAMRCARRFVEMNPKLGAVLDRAGMGNDPRVVRVIAARAVALERTGRLTVKGTR